MFQDSSQVLGVCGLFFVGFGWIGTASGFVLLFGPHNSPMPQSRANLGALLYLGGLGVSTIGAIAGAILF